ncbi:MAG: HD domain-containing protein [Saccharofermentanales bacterium]
MEKNRVLCKLTDAIAEFEKNKTDDNFAYVLEIIRIAVNQNITIPVAVNILDDSERNFDSQGIKISNSITSSKDFNFEFRYLTLGEDREVLVAFTSESEVNEKSESAMIDIEMESLLESAAMDPDIFGVLFNPWGHEFYLNKELIHYIFTANLTESESEDFNTAESSINALDIDQNYLSNQADDEDSALNNNNLLNEAIVFAVKCHENQLRKGTLRPYILHPLATMQILAKMNADTNLLIAGLLHDVIEDSQVTIDEIITRFGHDVARLVKNNSEDKSKSWYQRKLKTINDLHGLNRRGKMLVLADKVANLRDMYQDYTKGNDGFWERFNAPKEMIAWYYGSIDNALSDFQNDEDVEAVYWELVELYKELFVRYFIDEEQGFLLQVSVSGEAWIMHKGSPEWELFKGDISRNFIPLSRRAAEIKEEIWTIPFWEIHRQDLKNKNVMLFDSEDVKIKIEIIDQKVNIISERCDNTSNFSKQNAHKELWYHLDQDNSQRFLVQLRLIYGLEIGLETILSEHFGYNEAIDIFKKFCTEVNVYYQCDIIQTNVKSN